MQLIEDKNVYTNAYTNTEWKWLNLISISIFHLIAFYSCFETIFYHKNILTVIWIIVAGDIAGLGVTAGVHRLWCHRTYKAKTGLRIFLALCFSMAGQNTIYDWVRDHRVHHKFSDTDADPHNASRGFWFSHVGWLTMKKHKEVKEKGKSIDMSDVVNDPVVVYHTKFFIPLKILFCFILPTLVPIYVWNESVRISILSQVFIRYAISLNFTWLVNSAAHLWGTKPYNENILPSENKLVSILAIGEGWHNYHHTFPYDYKAAELGKYSLNLTTMFLDLFAKFGWAYDLKEPNKEYLKKRFHKKTKKENFIK